jgi:DEAD/DEAH box helicase domain-containing protein
MLEYCYKHRTERGIKALIIYPMNALCSDQAKRIAKLIFENKKLCGNVSAGIYVGGGEYSPSNVMSENSIISKHEIMQDSPPDILLTNYKMLDYLLVRPIDARIWNKNVPKTLKYIAVDELHSFDGAQGTDLACLLRRFKARLNILKGHLCCIGTSATMTSNASTSEIIKYASEIFGERFDEDCVITEKRLTHAEFFDVDPFDFKTPDVNAIKKVEEAISQCDQKAFLECATKAWLDDFSYTDIMSDKTRIDLGEHLKRHNFLQNLLRLVCLDYIDMNEICSNKSLRKSLYPLTELKDAQIAIETIFALISHARIKTQTEMLRPFLTLNLHLWIKELRRLLATVSSENIKYAVATELNENQIDSFLPVLNCSSCGKTGWVSILTATDTLKISDLSSFYKTFFNKGRKLDQFIAIFPENIKGLKKASICPKCLSIDLNSTDSSQCALCGTGKIPVSYSELEYVVNRSAFKCPHCNSTFGLAIVGMRNATMISVSISQLFASKFNDDKKTLAFSDNIQDAAHRAGFFTSRTYKVTLRSAIQKYILNCGELVNLSELSENFVEYLDKNLSKEELVSLFTAPNMMWEQSYESMKLYKKFPDGDFGKIFISDIKKRLSYEIMLEYGILSKFDRSLEKSRCSVISWSSDDLKKVANMSFLKFNEAGNSNALSNESFEHIVIGFVNILAQNGAFNDETFKGYILNKGNQYYLANKYISWLPGLNSWINTPRFIYQSAEFSHITIDNFDELKSSGNGIYARWVNKCLNGVFCLNHEYNKIAMIVIDALEKNGLVNAMINTDNYKVWGLSKKKARVSAIVSSLKCDTCGHTTYSSEDNSSIWNGAPCMKCSGRLKLEPACEIGYFSKLYNFGDTVRVIAKDHTSCLDRNDRDLLEKAFKSDKNERKPWYPNVLSCTPTLEMGIDIGDLSSVILCSVPPGSAQYLQRSGRSGRKDGNSLSITIANTKPHDLYFFTDPKEIFKNVEPPKVFLNAPAILERQFLAYSMDDWVMEKATVFDVPKTIETSLNNLNNGDSTKFPFNFLSYLVSKRATLYNTFINLFTKDELSKNASEYIKKFVLGLDDKKDPPVKEKIINALEAIKNQRDALEKSMRDLNSRKKILENKRDQYDPSAEINELEEEYFALDKVVSSINSKDVFNFLSDEGLLPNYAFPESGMILKAILTKKYDNNDKKPTHAIYEYNRPSATAINEFAPSNHFYVDGHKLNINQIDLTTTKTEKWRLCPTCSHAQLDESENTPIHCPNCGDINWGDQGQLRSMLKVQMVYSKMIYQESLIDDSHDSRETTSYCTQFTVDVKDSDDLVAFKMDNDYFSFGYEYRKNATLREINFGENNEIKTLSVSGRLVTGGFKVCPHCGKVQIEDKLKHAINCKALDPNTLESQDTLTDCLFLYREFKTEILRLLIPSTNFDPTKVREESFIAAFMLGMKNLFGNVDHLKTIISDVPIDGNDCRKLYLVVYDSIPGGSGYLKQLMLDTHSLIEVFERSLRVLKNCKCDDTQDGCYRCLYAYRQSRNISHISKKTAISLLEQILSGKGNKVKIGNLNDVPIDSLLDSELERQFLFALQKYSKDRKGSLINQFVNNKPGYRLEIGRSTWEIEPQVDLDSLDGVFLKTRPDFIMRLVSEDENQINKSNKKNVRKSVAIYTDGFFYHKSNVADDTKKREAVRRSGKFRVWSFSWKDVLQANQKCDYATNTLDIKNNEMYNKIFQHYYKQSESEKAPKLLHINDVSNLEILFEYLENPDMERQLRAHALAYVNLFPYKKAPLNINEISERNTRQFLENSLSLGNDALTIKLFSWIPKKSEFLNIYSSKILNNPNNGVEKLFAVFNDNIPSIEKFPQYERDWNGFWQLCNVLQFFDNFTFVSTLATLTTTSIMLSKLDNIVSDSISLDNSWKAIISQLLDDKTKNYARACEECKIPAPDEVGYELQSDEQIVIGEAEMVWIGRKIAFFREDQEMVNIPLFKNRGWKILTLETQQIVDFFS